MNGKLYNEGGELVAEGGCEVDFERGNVTMHPSFDSPALDRQEGLLRLELDDEREFEIAGRVIRFRLNVPGSPVGDAYRLTFTDEQKLRLTQEGLP